MLSTTNVNEIYPTSSLSITGREPGTVYTLTNNYKHKEPYDKDTKYGLIKLQSLELEKHKIKKHRLTCEKKRKNRK